MKGLRNGISCSTGSELTLPIVGSYYRLLPAKADNTASRSGKTQALINSISGRKSSLAVRVRVSVAAVPGDAACAAGSACGWQSTQQLRLEGFTGDRVVSPLLKTSQGSLFQTYVLGTGKKSCFPMLQLLTDLLFAVAFAPLLSVISCRDVGETRRQPWSSPAMAMDFPPCCLEQQERGQSREAASLDSGSTFRL